MFKHTLISRGNKKQGEVRPITLPDLKDTSKVLRCASSDYAIKLKGGKY